AGGRSVSARILAGRRGRDLIGPSHISLLGHPRIIRATRTETRPMYTHLLKSLNSLHPRAWDFVQLMRLEKPIGIYLLLWPTLWALWVAAEGVPSAKNLFVFIFGVILMRAAGCVINDYADRNFDGHVKRTQARPLASGKVTPREALILFAVLVALSFVLVLFTNLTTILLSFGGLALAACYPFMKRYTYYPQVVL